MKNEKIIFIFIIIIFISIITTLQYNIYKFDKLEESFKQQTQNTTSVSKYKSILCTDPTLTPREYSECVCQNLEKVENNTLRIYPEIVHAKTLLLQDSDVLVRDIQGNNVYSKEFDTTGVMCYIPTVVCNIHYCLTVDISVPVNYTEWELWR